MDSSLCTKNIVIDLLLVSLEARQKKAGDYIYNSDMLLEAELLSAQIEALKATREED